MALAAAACRLLPALVAVALSAAVRPPVAGGTPQAAPDPKAIVLKAGPIAMTMNEVRQAFHYAASADTSTLTPDAAGVDRFLDEYVPVVVAQAVALKDTTIFGRGEMNALDMFKEGQYRDGVRDRLITKYVKSDEAVVRAVYDRMKTQLHLAVIRVPTLIEMDSVRAELARGVPFGDVARRRSRDRSSGNQAGNIGWLDATRFTPDQQEILWAVPDKGISPVVSDQSFHSIYRVIERRPGPPLKSFEEERDDIVRAISKSQLPKAAQEIHDHLLASYHYRVDPAAAEWMRAFLQKETATARRDYDPNLDKSSIRLDEPPKEKPFWTEAPLKGDDARRPVAFIDGDTLHALEVIDQLVFEPTLVWPTFASVNDVNDLCDEAFTERIQVREALRLGVEKDPEFIRRMTNHKASIAWRAYRAKVLLPKIRPTDAELQAEYERQIARFRLPERRRFVAVGVGTPELAQKAAGLLRLGMAPSNVGRQLMAEDPTLLIETSPDTGMGIVRYGENPALDTTIFGMAEGQVSDPVPDRGGYAVLRIDGILAPRTQSLEEVRRDLENEIIAPREKKAIAEIVAGPGSSIPVWVDRAAIERMDLNLTTFERRGKPPVR